MLLFGVTQCDNYLMRMQYFTKESELSFIMYGQRIELSFIKIGLVSMITLHFCNFK